MKLLYIITVIVTIVVVISIPVSWKLNKPSSVPWSHRCYSDVFGDNTIVGCKNALDRGFSGIEVDLFYEDQTFVMKHDTYLQTNDTLEEMLRTLQNYTYGLILDFKTPFHYRHAQEKMINLLNKHQPGGTIIIESQNGLYDKFFENHGYKTGNIRRQIGYAVDIKSGTALWWEWPYFFFSTKETYVATAKSQCDYLSFAWAKPSVILVDLTSPVIQCSGGKHADKTYMALWVILWCILWSFIACVVVYLIMWCQHKDDKYKLVPNKNWMYI